MNFRAARYHKVFLLALVLALSSGCALVVGGMVGGGATAYLKGVLKTKEPASFDRVWLAVVETVEQQEFEIIKKESGKSKALIEAKMDETRYLYVTVKYYQPEITDLSIRVGVWGNESESRHILKLIHEKLY